MQSESESLQRDRSSKDPTLVYVVAGVPQKEYMQMYRLQNLAVPLNGCPSCSMNTLYMHVDDAYEHLHTAHCGGDQPPTEENKTKLRHQIISLDDLEKEFRNMDIIKLMQTLRCRATKLVNKAIKIRNSAVNDRNEKDERALILDVLVVAV
ncbi:hypothetical protein BU23DRAFT_89761 [Bimuria novae-zelandiae CBS 107.79]|uniref:Uncharacterized protein n=1 Tax=Bimuria novae-zelandiae CBS 107.79 TaxID=1447943 RepID=A0A6A5VFN9_9PLEO|nr:hypothetical protein BU23DRAFT_89761 [Bimuria novae-zelandiae CBS 107.79]